jgi:hypothetical protein
MEQDKINKIAVIALIFSLLGLTSYGTPINGINGTDGLNGSLLVDNSKVNKSGDTMTGSLYIPQIFTEYLNSYVGSSLYLHSQATDSGYSRIRLNGYIPNIVSTVGDSNGVFSQFTQTASLFSFTRDINLNNNNLLNCGNCLTNETMAHDNLKVNKTDDIRTGNLSTNVASGYIASASGLGYSGTSLTNFTFKGQNVTRLDATGSQTWELRGIDTSGNPLYGYISYSFPGGYPGILFYNSVASARKSIYTNTNSVIISSSASTTNVPIVAIRDDGNMGLLTAGKGIQLLSPDGTAHCVTVSNLNILTTTAGACT